MRVDVDVDGLGRPPPNGLIINIQHPPIIHTYTQMKIDEADHEVYNGWGWVSQVSFFSEVVQFLKAEEVQGPIVPAQSAEGCCVVS